MQDGSIFIQLPFPGHLRKGAWRMYECVSGACALPIPLLFEGIENFVCVAYLCLAYFCAVTAHCKWLQPASAVTQHVLCTMCTILGPKPLGLQIPAEWCACKRCAGNQLSWDAGLVMRSIGTNSLLQLLCWCHSDTTCNHLSAAPLIESMFRWQHIMRKLRQKGHAHLHASLALAHCPATGRLTFCCGSQTWSLLRSKAFELLRWFFLL